MPIPAPNLTNSSSAGPKSPEIELTFSCSMQQLHVAFRKIRESSQSSSRTSEGKPENISFIKYYLVSPKSVLICAKLPAHRRYTTIIREWNMYCTVVLISSWNRTQLYVLLILTLAKNCSTQLFQVIHSLSFFIWVLTELRLQYDLMDLRLNTTDRPGSSSRICFRSLEKEI